MVNVASLVWSVLGSICGTALWVAIYGRRTTDRVLAGIVAASIAIAFGCWLVS